MEGLNNLPKCFNSKNCSCFESLYIEPLFYNGSDIFQYTEYHQEELQKYIQIVSNHLQLDQHLGIKKHECVSANEIAKATNLFLDSVKRFQTQLLKYANRGEPFITYYNERVSVTELIQFYQELGEINLKSLHLFNRPSSALTTKHLTDVLEMHKNCLYIMEHFYTFIMFGRPIHKNGHNNPNVHSIRFR